MLERVDSLARALARRKRFVIERPRRAAILLPLLSSGTTPSLLLTRRSEELSSHKGQVAFPGGRADDGDDGPIETSLREAREEVGLRHTDARILGMLDDIPSFQNDTSVTPVVARLAPHADISTLAANSREVSRIFAIPIDELLERSRWEVRPAEWRGKPIEQYYFRSQGETLWGLSALATLMMLALVPGRRAPVPRWFKREGRELACETPTTAWR